MTNDSHKANPGDNSWEEQQITLQDIILSNSWAVQAILNYLEECDPNARDRIWYHYEQMKKQQETAHSEKNPENQPSDCTEIVEEDSDNI